MPGAVEAMAEYAEETLKNPPEEEGKKSPEENNGLEDKEQITTSASMLDGKDQQQLAGSEKMQSGGSEKMQLCGSEQTHSLAGTEERDESEKVQLQNKKLKKRKRSELQQIKQEEPCDADNTQVLVDAEEPASEPSFLSTWSASYYTVLYQHEKALFKGSILVDPKVNCLSLLDDEETVVDTRKLREGELIYPGLELEFPCHIVQIGMQIVQAKEDERGADNEKQPSSKRYKKDRIDEKKRNKLKRNRSVENWERVKEVRRKTLRSPQAKLVGSPIGLFARVAALRKEMSPQVQGRRSESPSVPNVTAHFPSPNLPRVEADFTRHRPRKLKSKIWKDFIPIYEHGKVVEGQCKHCNDVFPASKSSGTNHIHRHLRKCEKRSSMHEMVAKMRASTPSPRVSLDNWTFSQKECRRDLAHMIVHHGLPFSIVDYSGFRKFVKSLNPMFKMVSRTIIREECMESYKEQRSMLREILKNCDSRVSLTADMWTSNQRLGYLCVTCHFIDKTWKMQKRILRFCMMETPHSGFRMYNVMLKSLQYWNIEDKICSITLDNASVNGSMMDSLKDNLMKKHMLTCKGKLFHIRCAAHVLNLVVQDGLFVMKGSIDMIRESVKYVKSSQSREQLFEDIVRQLSIVCDKEPSLDVAHRWNSTYLMIDSALPYMAAFDELAKQDLQFKYSPSADDWKMAEAIRSLLKIFFEATKVVSGSTYPTANRYFHEIWSVRQLLAKQASNKEPIIASMVSKMQKKFDKYWKESYLVNCIPVILDPRYKRSFIEFRLGQAFGHNAGEHLKKVDMIIKSLFEDYSRELGDPLATNPSEEEVQDGVAEFDDSLADWQAHLRVQKKQVPNEIERYLAEELFPPNKDFDILGWWKLHGPKYPVLSCIARDVLAIQASTVASESSFSAGGRILTDHRSRLKSKMVEALICLQDWLKAADPKPINKDAEEEECLVFYQLSECDEETAAHKAKGEVPEGG